MMQTIAVLSLGCGVLLLLAATASYDLYVALFNTFQVHHLARNIAHSRATYLGHGNAGVDGGGSDDPSIKPSEVVVIPAFGRAH